MRTVLPGRPRTQLQALSTALWDGIRVVAYISGRALVILNGPHKLLQTIYQDDAESLDAVTIEENSGRIAVCSGAHIFVYFPFRVRYDTVKWKLERKLGSSEACDDHIKTLSWGGPDELLAGNSTLSLWSLTDTPRIIWTNSLANPVKIAQFSYDSSFIASTGEYDRLVKVWRRAAFGTEEVRFDVSYLPHAGTITGVHWSKPRHKEQTIENVLFTICVDNKIRIWAAMERHGTSALQLWNEIDMEASIQPRYPLSTGDAHIRYCFIIDSRDFAIATERAVEHDPTDAKDKHALEHLVGVATKSSEVCVIMDARGHMCAWGLENVGAKKSSPSNVFNIAHVEGLNLSFASGHHSKNDYVQFCSFVGGVTDASFTLLAHYFDGRIEWFDAKVCTLFDPTPRKKRLVSKAVWSGHAGSIKKIVRTPSGKFLSSRTDDNKAMIWRQRPGSGGSALIHQSSLLTDMHIHRTCLIDEGNFLVNLHHDGVSLWDIRSPNAEMLAACDFHLSSKPLCVLLLPTAEIRAPKFYVAAIGADMAGIAWEIELPEDKAHGSEAKTDVKTPKLHEFCTFHLESSDDVAYILPVDPAGTQLKISGFLDLFATDIALSYSHSGTVKTWTAKVDQDNRKVDWLLTSTVETGITSPSLASAGSARKTALVDQERTHLTIWDTNGAQLEYEERFSAKDIIQDLDWTTTPDIQSILAVGFPHKVILLSQLRYDYIDAGPSWAQIREIHIQDLTPHPIGDSCWLGNGNLVVGAGNQLFIFDKHIESNNKLVTSLRLPYHKTAYVDLFQIVSRLNGQLPIFHPQFLAQCILCGKTSLVHLILTTLYRKLKFFTEGDELNGFLDIPLEEVYTETSELRHIAWKEMRSSSTEISFDEEAHVVNETIATSLNEQLTRIALPQLSTREQFLLVDTIECVSTVEKHRRSMDDNAARYLLFFRQHILRRSQSLPESTMVSWREIVWAFHSDSHEILADLVKNQFQGKMVWEQAKESGIFMWLGDANAVRAQLEVVARNEYSKTDERNPVDCTLYYLALKKKNILQGLWRMATWHREQASTQRLLSNNFKESRWRTAALKNAYALLGKRRFEYAAAFFLLADHLRDAVNVCLNQVKDVQLAITIARAYEGDDGPVLREILEDRVLVDAAAEGNRWMATWAFWMLNRRDMAVRALISPVESLLLPTPASPPALGAITLHAKSYLSNDPALVVLYKQLREKTLQTLKGAAKVPARDEWEFVLRNARLYDRMGCDLLALNLVREWEFLNPLPAPAKSTSFIEEAFDPQKMLRRRSSLVVADLPSFDGLHGQQKKAEGGKPTAPPTSFQEPDSNSLLDSFGF